MKSAIKSLFNSEAIFEIKEDGQLKSCHIDECNFAYDGLEYIYTNAALEFVLYFSHENSTTVGGQKLIAEIHRMWPEYANHLWKSTLD